MNIFRSTRARVCTAIGGTLVLSAGVFGSSLMGVARADYAPTSYNSGNGQGDVVGVGSDTLQYLMDFAADGSYGANAGFNAGKKFKIVSFDATADSNARLAYLVNSTSAQNPTIVLRAGSVPIQRPNGSGAGIAALLADVTQTVTGTAVQPGVQINFARASRLPKVSEANSANSAGSLWGGLEDIQIATENLAVYNTTGGNAPAGLSISQLNLIYSTCTSGVTLQWNDPRIGGTSSDHIIPVIPQTGSGTRSTFEGDIGLADAVAVANTASGCIKVSEENDPTALKNLGADAIGPLSGSRVNMFNGLAGDGSTVAASGYFHDPNTALSKTNANGYPGGAVLTPGVTLVNGVPAGTGVTSTVSYADQRGLNIVIRKSDEGLNGRGWQPGGTQSWLQTLFLDSTAGNGIGSNWFGTGGGQTDMNDAGATATGVGGNYIDCGNGLSGVGTGYNAACGVHVVG